MHGPLKTQGFTDIQIFFSDLCKLGCVVRMVVDSILPHAECGPNDHRKDAPPFIKRSAWLLRSFPYKNFGRRLRLRRWEKGKSSSKNPINYNYLVTSSMTSPSWIIPHMKALDLKFCIASRLSLATTWWRSRAIRKISKNGFSATPSGRILMIYTLKVHKYYCDSDDVCIMTFWGHKRSNVGQNRKIRVKPGRLVEIYRTYICFDSEFYPEFKFKIF